MANRDVARGSRGPCPPLNRRLRGFLTKQVALLGRIGPTLLSKVTLLCLAYQKCFCGRGPQICQKCDGGRAGALPQTPLKRRSSPHDAPRLVGEGDTLSNPHPSPRRIDSICPPQCKILSTPLVANISM